MDGAALAQSKNILIQVGTRARPIGWVQHDATLKTENGKKTFPGKKVISTGTMPWLIEDTNMSVTVKNPQLRNARLLDLNGNAHADLNLAAADGAVKLRLPTNAMYVVLQSE